MKSFAVHYSLLVILLACALSFSSCIGGDGKNKFSNPKEVTDAYGRKVTFPKKPKRIISVSPGITENIFALGEGSRLTGRSSFCKYPKEVDSIADIGDMLQINIEKILSLHPDLVLVGSIVPKSTVDFFNNVDIPVVAMKETPKFSGIYENLQLLGYILDKEEKANEIILSLKKQLQDIQSTQCDSYQKPSAYYVVGYGQGGEFTAGGNTYISDIIELSGAQNIAKDIAGWAFSRELLFERNPEYIFIRKEDFEDFCRTLPYSNLRAVKTGKTFPIESSWVDVQTPRSIEAIKYISKCISAK